MSTGANAVATQQTFEDRMKARIKDSIGDLITDEDLTKMLERGIEEVFFKEKVVKTGTYYNDTKVVPPLIHQVVKECLEPAIIRCADRYLATKADEVNAIIQKVVDEGVMQAVNRAFEARLQTHFINFGSQVQEMVRTMPR